MSGTNVLDNDTTREPIGHQSVYNQITSITSSILEHDGRYAINHFDNISRTPCFLNHVSRFL